MSNYLDNLVKVLSQPKQFFQELPLTGGYGEPLKFAAINIFIASALNLATKLILVKPSLSAPSLIISLIVSVIGGIIGLFIGYGIIHILLKIFGAKKGYEATFRVGAYLTAFGLLSWIPYVVFVVVLYMLYLEVVIFARVHEISTLRSFLAVMLIPIILLIMVVAAGLSYFWVSSLQNDVMSQTRNQIMSSESKNTPVNTASNEQILIDSVLKKDNRMNIVLRNIGQAAIYGKDIKAYLNDAVVSSSGCEQLNPSEICTVALDKTPFPSSGAKIKISVLANKARADYMCSATDKDWC